MACGHIFEKTQSIREAALVDCPECSQPGLRRVSFPPTILDATPRTLGAFAEKNTDTMGAYALQKLQHERAEWVRGVRPDQPDGPPPRDEVLYQRPDWLSPDAEGPRLDLLKLSPDQQANYIETGNPNASE